MAKKTKEVKYDINLPLLIERFGSEEKCRLYLEAVRWHGFPAWFIARTYHLLLMPGLGRKLRLLADWNVALVFGRDASAPGRLGSPTPLDPDPGSDSPPTRS